MTTIARAETADIAALAQLHLQIFGSHGPQPAQELSRMAERGIVLCARDPQGPVGLAVGMVAADELEVHTVAVAPQARRGGQGMRLLRALEEAAAQAGALQAFLEVRASNTAARALYLSAGYTVSGERAGYYHDGEDAVVMHRMLQP